MGAASGKVTKEQMLLGAERWHKPLQANDGIAQQGSVFGNAGPFDDGRDLPSTESALKGTLPTNCLDVAVKYRVQEHAFGWHSGRKPRTNNRNHTRKTPREIWDLSQEKTSAQNQS